jgi:hypothetical protein
MWSSLGVSIAITAGAFIVAFASMMPIARWRESRLVEVDQPTVVRLAPPVQLVPKPKPEVHSAQRVAAPPVAAPIAPRLVAPTSPIAPPVVAPITQPIAKAAPRDSSPGSHSGPVIPLGPVRYPIDIPGGAGAPLSHLGAPLAPAGVTSIDKLPNTPEVRDSIAAAGMNTIPLLAKTHAPKGAELAELSERQRVAVQLARRATTAGNARDVHVMTGEGLDGVGAVNGGRTGFSPLGGSIGFSLFSSGPTAEQRKANEKLDAEYQARLHRLQDRAFLLADAARVDSVRADSLRRDSFHRDSLARRARRLAP